MADSESVGEVCKLPVVPLGSPEAKAYGLALGLRPSTFEAVNDGSEYLILVPPDLLAVMEDLVA